MPNHKFYIEIMVRYSDLDPQGHVNNARFLSFIEQARLDYLQHLGLWDGTSFLDLGLIVADAHMAYLAPLFMGQTVRVSAWVTRLGNKSLRFEYELEESASGQICGRGDTVMVAYNYRTEQTTVIPDHWRQRIAAAEGIAERE